MVLEPPVRRNQQFLRRLRCKALKHKVWTQTFDVVNDSLNIIIDPEKREIIGTFGVLSGHACTAYQLQLMKFKCSQR